MKSFFKKAKNAYKQHFYQTQAGEVNPNDPEQMEKMLKDINPNDQKGPQGFIAYCDDSNPEDFKPTNSTTTPTTTQNDQDHHSKENKEKDKDHKDHKEHKEHKDKDQKDKDQKDDQQPQPQPQQPLQPLPQQHSPRAEKLKKEERSPSVTEKPPQQPQQTTTTENNPPSQQPQPTNNTNSSSTTNNSTTTATTGNQQQQHQQQSSLTSAFSKFKLSKLVGGKNKESASDKKIVNNKSPGSGVGGGHQKTPEQSEKKDEAAGNEKVEREIIMIKCLEDLPDDCLKLVKTSGLPEDKLRQNLQTLLYVLHFRTGKIIKLEGEAPREPRKKFVSERFNDGESLLVPVDPLQLKKLYKDSDQVGKGGFGTVYFARSTKEKKTVAIKKVPHQTKRQIQQNFREVSILSKCNHPNIVKLITCHLDKDSNLWIIMEFMEGGTFEEAAKAWKFNENNLAYVARELLKGLQYMHENGMVHRDLKSANIMMSVEGKVKLIDFGLCEDVSTGNPCHMVGSPFWMAPEMIQQKPHGTPVDIWSFAISLLEMANQRPPMMESAVKAMFTVATEGADTVFDEPELWSDCFKDFLSRCLKMDPSERATAADLLLHPFIKKADSRDNMENILKKIFLTNSLMNSGF
eukprot:gene899-1124_t